MGDRRTEDRQAYEFYADPANQVPAGPARQRQGRRLSTTVPVRFPQDLIEAVKRLAARDGVTVSSWIRQLVTNEVKRRQPPEVTTTASEVIRYVATDKDPVRSETASGVGSGGLVMEMCG